MSDIISYYNTFDEWGRLEREPVEFQVNWHYIKKYLPSTGHILDNGAGPGKYSMALAADGYSVTLTDLTPKLVKIAEDKAQELHLAEQFEAFHVAVACFLTFLKYEQFYSPFLVGPMYILQ